MKPILIFILTCLPAISLFSQDWAPFPPGDTLIYDRTSTPELDLSVWVEEVIETADGEEWKLNPHHRPCDTCDNLLPLWIPALLINQAFPFGSKTIVGTDGSYRLQIGNGRNLLLLPKDPSSSVWILDTVNGVNANLLNQYQGSIWGKTDEFRLIGLSTGDSILLSKNHGAIYFPDSISYGERLELFRIKNRGLGKEVLSFWDIYDFQPGDILCYKYGTGMVGVNYSFESKVTVLSVVRDVNRIVVEVEMRGIKYHRGFYIGSNKYGFSGMNDTWTFVNSRYEPINRPPGALQFAPPYGSFWSPRIYWEQPGAQTDSSVMAPAMLTDSTLEMMDYYVVANYKDNRGMWGSFMPDSLPTDVAPRVSSVNDFKVIYQKGLGLTYFSFAGFEGGSSLQLVGYIRDQDTVGEIFTEEYLHVDVEDELLAAGISVFPNPSQGPVMIQVSQAALLPSELTIFTLTGKKVYTSRLSQQESIIEVATFPKGIYLMQLQVPDGRTLRSRLVVR